MYNCRNLNSGQFGSKCVFQNNLVSIGFKNGTKSIIGQILLVIPVIMCVFFILGYVLAQIFPDAIDFPVEVGDHRCLAAEYRHSFVDVGRNHSGRPDLLDLVSVNDIGIVVPGRNLQRTGYGKDVLTQHKAKTVDQLTGYRVLGVIWQTVNLADQLPV